MPRRTAFGIALALLALAPAPPSRGQAEAEGLSASFRKAARRVLPAVVTVRAEGDAGRVAPLLPPGLVPGLAIEMRGPALPRAEGGSGVVIDAAAGLVLTNDHVVQGANRVVVVLPDGRERVAGLVRRDPKSDLAVLSIEPGGLAQADWGDAEALDIGDWVLAVGQPFGLSGTVTAGIVSGKGRGIGLALYEDLIQTDAAIHPGNSGGPLVNLRGEVVGINTAIKTSGGGSEGVGFAVPASRARRVARDLVEVGRVRRSYLGVTIVPAGAEVVARLGRPGAVAITGVAPGSPADRAGLQPGDILTRFGGKPVVGVGPLQAAIEVATAGEPLALRVERSGQTLELPATPESQPDAFGRVPEVPTPATALPGPFPVAPREPGLAEGGAMAAPGRTRIIEIEPIPPADRGLIEAREPSRFPELGLVLAEPTAAPARRFRADPAVPGLVVVGVTPDGPADRGGFERGMVITDLGTRRTADLAAFRAAVSAAPPGRDLVARVVRGAKAEFRIIVLEARPAPEGAPPPPEPPRSGPSPGGGSGDGSRPTTE